MELRYTNSDYFNEIQKKFTIRKMMFEKVFNSSNKTTYKPNSYRGNFKSLALENTNRPIGTNNKSGISHIENEKKVKLNIQTVLFPYKKKKSLILHKKSKSKYQNISNNTNTNETSKPKEILPLVHRRTYSENKNFVMSLRKGGSLSTLAGGDGKFEKHINISVIKASKFKIISNSKEKQPVSNERNLMMKLQNQKIKEIVF
jgi:hypothetical protein